MILDEAISPINLLKSKNKAALEGNQALKYMLPKAGRE
jgi:hypothetical protein